MSQISTSYAKLKSEKAIIEILKKKIVVIERKKDGLMFDKKNSHTMEVMELMCTYVCAPRRGEKREGERDTPSTTMMAISPSTPFTDYTRWIWLLSYFFPNIWLEKQRGIKEIMKGALKEVHLQVRQHILSFTYLILIEKHKLRLKPHQIHSYS